MLILSLPAISAHDPERTAQLHERWGRENFIIWGRTNRAEFAPLIHTLSIRAVWGGVEHCVFQRRTVGVDDDNYLIINPGRNYATSIRSSSPVESLSIGFRPELVRETQSALQTASLDKVLDWTGAAGPPPEFIENLQPHDQTVSPILRYLRSHLASGFSDETWYDEQLVFLLARMQRRRCDLMSQIDRLTPIRKATRHEVYRRIGLATDFLHTHYASRLDLTLLATIACLSKYHFLRLFSLVHHMTPHRYLQRKRTSVAARLLQSSHLTGPEVAESVGFAHESTLLRQMLRWQCQTPGQIRARAAENRGSSSFEVPLMHLGA